MHLLLVEDDAEQRELLSQLLERHGLETRTAGSIREARALLSQESPPLVVTDYDLGDGFATELFADGLLDPEHTIVLTAHGHPDVPAGVSVLRKPTPLGKFIALLEQRLDRPFELRATLAHDDPAHDPTDESVAVAVVLYVSGGMPSSAAAHRRVEDALSELTNKGLEVSLTVIDLAREPERASNGDQIVFTPTLIRRKPEPSVRLIGDMSDQELLRDVLAPLE